MKHFYVLDCPYLQKIQDSLYGYYKSITANKQVIDFWNNLSRQQVKDYLAIPNLEIVKWFDGMDLRIRDISYTVTTMDVFTSPHVDEPPVVAKINIPVLNTNDTYNVWYNEDGSEIDRVECVKPIVLRSNVKHSVEMGRNATYPRIQFSFCFYNEPLHLLR